MAREDLNDPKTKPQRDRFVEKARELDCDEDEDHFTDIPAVLVELGYLSNRRDEKRLSSKSGRAPLVEALTLATEGFFKGVGAP